jgi:hypothetical protein
MSQVDDILVRRAPATKSSWNPKSRTLEVVVSTFADYRRYGFIERLSRDPADWDLSRVSSPAGVPFLDSHNSFSSDARLGRVMSVSIGKNDIRADVKLNDSEDANALVREIEGGTPPGISFGYNVGRWMLVEDSDDGSEVRVAREITVLEVSAVSVAADAGAHIREEARMPKQAPATDPVDEPVDDNVKIFGPTEKKRMVERFGLDQAFYTRHAKKDEAAFRAAVLDALVDEHETSDIRSHVQIRDHGSLDNPASFRAAAVTAFLDRIHGRASEGLAAGVFANGEAAFARRVLQNCGQDIRGWSDQRVLRSYATTSDFSLIAGGVANVRVVETYREAAAPINEVFGQRLVPDFNKFTDALVDWTTLKIDKVNEHGEFKTSYVDEAGEVVQVFTVGGIVPLSRQLQVNAHGALDDLATNQGLALAAYTATRKVEFIEQNTYAGPKMADNKNVFSTGAGAHGNIETLHTYNQNVTAQELMKLRGKAARRKGAGDVIIGVPPSIWLVHPDDEGYALQTLASINASELANVNPAAGRFKIISEPRLTAAGKSWILADPAKMRGAVQVVLEGQEAPYTESQAGFEIDGTKFKIRLDFGLSWLEWRSWTRLDHDSTDPET